MISKTHLKFIKSLQIKKYRNQTNRFLVEGEKSILELLKSSFKINTLLTTKRFLQNHIELIRSRQPEYHEVSEDILKKAGSLQQNQSALAVVEIPEIPPLKMTEYRYLPFYEQLQDPGNLGAIIRICDWYGLKAVVLSDDSVDVYNPKVIQASMGSFIRVRVYYMSSEELINRNDHYPVIGTVLDGVNLHSFHWPEKGMIVFGNESKGISREVQDRVDQKISVPGYGRAESLNVAVASAVVFDNLARNRYDGE